MSHLREHLSEAQLRLLGEMPPKGPGVKPLLCMVQQGKSATILARKGYAECVKLSPTHTSGAGFYVRTASGTQRLAQNGGGA